MRTKRRWTIACCAGLALLSAGCDATVSGSASAGSTQTTTEHTGAAPTSAPEIPEKTTTTITTTKPPSAKDGANIAACRDDVCEVKVHAGITIPLSGRHGLDSLMVTLAGPRKVTLRNESDGGFIQVSMFDQGRGRLNEINVRVLSVDKDSAIVRIAPA